MDILFPPDIPIAAMAFGIDDFTAVDESATTGGMQSSALYGTRRWHLRMDFGTLSRSNGSLARFESLVASFRGRANRVWIALAQQKLRGSFPATEMFTNNDFSGGTSGWTADAQYSLSALDHGIRATRAQVAASTVAISQAATVSTGIPYAFRFFINAGRGSVIGSPSDFTDNINIATGGSQGLFEGAYTPATAGSHIVGLFATQAGLAGDFFDAKWASFSRCAQVDNGVNLLLNSDTPGTGTGWSLAAATAATAGAAISPDGTADAWGLTETATTAQHFASQAVTIAAAAADHTTSFIVAANTRTWCVVQGFDGTNSITRWFNLATGALGTLTVGTNFTHISSSCVDYGNGWKRCTICYRKGSAATSLTSVLSAATADNVLSYLGVSSSIAIYTWRASFAQSSVPVRPVQTAGTAQTGTLQTGYTLALKGLPVSTQGLLLEADVVECVQPVNSQLLRVVARLDSDGAGLGTLIFENALKQSPVNGAGVIVQQPMGRFVLASSTLGIEYTPGVFGQASLEFVEAA